MENLRHLPTVLLIFILLNCPPSLSLFLFSVAFLFILIFTLAFSFEKQKQKRIKIRTKSKAKVKKKGKAEYFFYIVAFAKVFNLATPINLLHLYQYFHIGLDYTFNSKKC